MSLPARAQQEAAIPVAEPPARPLNYEISPLGVSLIMLTFEGKIQTKKCHCI
jgi:energy-converting hydrogenase Eha subunit E